MIKLERISVMNFENAIRGARNPMNSWDRMDSYYDEKGNFVLGPNDLDLAKRLVRAGSDHRKFLRQIFVSVDITAPLYWWKEFDTYKVATVANSCSTMHKIHARDLTIDDFSYEHLSACSKGCLENTIFEINYNRKRFIETKEQKYWLNMIQLLSTSYNQMRTITLNYEVLLNIYCARKHHKLAEWHTCCDWIETLPYFKEMCLGDNNG